METPSRVSQLANRSAVGLTMPGSLLDDDGALEHVHAAGEANVTTFSDVNSMVTGSLRAICYRAEEA